MDSIIVDNGEIAYRYINNKNYYVTKTGDIYSIFVKGGHGKVDTKRPHKIAYGVSKDGYFRVVLSDNGNKKYIKVHQVVAEQFLGKQTDGLVVNHKDGNKKNNCVSNLEYVTVKENAEHAHAHGLTTNEIAVDVEYDGEKYHFASMKECNSIFSDLSLHYLQQLKQNIIIPSMVLFHKVNPEARRSQVKAIYNGVLIGVYNSMDAAGRQFGLKRGSVYSCMVSNIYREKVNKYHVTFPNVSTIEHTSNTCS